MVQEINQAQRSDIEDPHILLSNERDAKVLHPNESTGIIGKVKNIVCRIFRGISSFFGSIFSFFSFRSRQIEPQERDPSENGIEMETFPPEVNPQSSPSTPNTKKVEILERYRNIRKGAEEKRGDIFAFIDAVVNTKGSVINQVDCARKAVEIKDLHPLPTLEQLFKHRLNQLEEVLNGKSVDGLAWELVTQGYHGVINVDGLFDRLDECVENDAIIPFFSCFCSAIEIEQDDLDPFVTDRDWEGMIRLIVDMKKNNRPAALSPIKPKAIAPRHYNESEMSPFSSLFSLYKTEKSDRKEVKEGWEDIDPRNFAFVKLVCTLFETSSIKETIYAIEKSKHYAADRFSRFPKFQTWLGNKFEEIYNAHKKEALSEITAFMPKTMPPRSPGKKSDLLSPSWEEMLETFIEKEKWGKVVNLLIGWSKTTPQPSDQKKPLSSPKKRETLGNGKQSLTGANARRKS